MKLSVVLRLLVIVPVLVLGVAIPISMLYDMGTFRASTRVLSWTLVVDAFASSLWRPLLLGCFSTVLGVVVGLPAGYALARLRFRGRRVVQLLVTLPVALPPVVLVAGRSTCWLRAAEDS